MQRFEHLSDQFLAIYHALPRDTNGLTSPFWEQINRSIEQVFLPRPPFDFLQHATIQYTMFVTAGGSWMRQQLVFLLKAVPNQSFLRDLLEEDYVGRPILLNGKYVTSHNTIHHAYHLFRYQTETGTQLARLGTIIEWGGGYGNLAKLVRRLNPEATYILIDTTLFSCIQWLYLTTVLAPEEVHLVRSPASTLQSGKINILPVSFVRNYAPRCELLISTWGLSESSQLAMDYVVGEKFFHAAKLLLAFKQESELFPNAERIREMAQAWGAAIVPVIDCLPGQYYAMK